MSKEYLEAFKNLKQELYYSPNQIPDIDKWHETIEKALQRLEQIDDAKPNEALKCLEKLGHLDLYESYIDLKVNEVDEFGIIKQALVKAQEQEKENDVLLGENDDLYTELAFCEKQYKETIEYAKKCTKLLKLINEKNVDVRYFKQQCNTLNDYNYCQLFGDELSQEEFDLLKECFKYER